MSRLITCPNCEMPYLPNEVGTFCPNCGAKLPTMLNVKKQITQIDNMPLPYSALRFVSGLLIAGGWLNILVGWVAIFVWWTSMNSTFVEMPGVDGTVLVDKIPPVFLVIAGFINTLVGVLIIGAGQVYSVILDIRDDMHSTMQYVRLGVKKIP